MKKVGIVFSLVLLTSLSLPSKADTADGQGNALLRFLASYQGIRNFAISTLITNRCDRYLSYREEASCYRAVNSMVKLLDSDIIFQENLTGDPQAFVFVAFKKNLIESLNKAETTKYLELLQSELNKYFVGEIPSLNIWEITLKYFKSPLAAARIMASLFQDTSLIKLHLAYLEEGQIRGNQHFQSNKHLLSQVIDTINMILDYSENNYRSLFYPKEIQGQLNRTIYHFYVPLYLSLELRAQKVHKDFAFIAPLLLTLTYEFITSSKNYSHLFSDPERLDPVAHAWRLRDIYGGYTGARFGFGLGHKIIPLQTLQETFKHSSAKAVKLMIER